MMYGVAYRDGDGSDFNGHPWVMLFKTLDGAHEFINRNSNLFTDTIVFKFERHPGEVITWDFAREHAIISENGDNIKIVDNFDLLADKLFQEPLDEDEFYFLQIITRGKDGNHVSGNNRKRLMQYYTITSKEQLLKVKNEVVAICHADNARAYINPTKRSFKGVANAMMNLMVKSYTTENWKGMKSLFSSSCGQSYISADKKFIVDLDDINPVYNLKDLEKYNEIVNFIKELRGHGGAGTDKVFATVPTKSGVHLITAPFEEDAFKKRYPDIDVHKNNPTLLYYRYIL